MDTSDASALLERSVVVVPFRLGSARYPRKALAPFRGKPLLWHAVAHAAALSPRRPVLTAPAEDLAEVCAALSFEDAAPDGVDLVPSSSRCLCATDRIVEIYQRIDGDVVLSLPVDEPALEPAALRRALGGGAELFGNAGALTFYCDFFCEEDFATPLSAKLVLDRDGYLLYMSRSAIPLAKDGSARASAAKKNVGAFLFARAFLDALAEDAALPTVLDRFEGLEQLRWLELGLRVRCLPVSHVGFGVDVAEQLGALERRVQQAAPATAAAVAAAAAPAAPPAPTPTPAACLPNTREIRVETSTACNYRCSMCPRESLTRPQQIMSDALFERVVRAARAEMPSLSMCTVSGFGDFCADPGWRNKLALARELFDEVHVVTNLARVDDDDIATLASLATEVRVSLYATTEETFRQVHKPPRGVRLCDIERRARALAARGGATLKMTCCELDANRDEIPTWITRWRHVAAHVEVWRPHNWVDGRAYREIAPAEQRLASCGRPAAGPIQVQVDGTINVCCFDYDGKMVVGDLSRQSLAEIFGGDALQRIRALHADGRADELDLCAVCDQRDPQQRRAEQLVYCSSADAAERVLRTSSGGETLRETRRA